MTVARLLGDLLGAFAFLTRLPVNRLWAEVATVELQRSVWAYPVVGAAVGGLGGGVFWLVRLAAVPPPLAAIVALAAMVLITGAMHEDGLADAADGLGGTTRERRLAIMRDSRVGSFGVVAVLLSLGLRATAIALLADPDAVVLALVAAGALGRGFLIALLLALPRARPDGMGATASGTGRVRGGAGLLLAIVPSVFLGSAVSAASAVAAAVLGAFLVGLLALRQFGGQTGDLLATAEQVIECLVLIVLATPAP